MADKATPDTGTQDSDKQIAVLELPTRLTIHDVGSLQTEWASLSNRHTCIDASHVQEIDTAGIQLLLTLVRELAGNGCNVTWNPSPSEGFLAVTKVLDIQDRLGVR